ncbi:uncharacterized protein LOC108623597 [Ceratina calcarata]|uniref:Uncharacterized protein LOC108623597 n=1 Tax=Ceratina calcarata TaxID=156304 RepID=A0AAJ7W9Q6_9HYME|nr:uncharacterized protein LOC108623597 [Ceratina calcarata]
MEVGEFTSRKKSTNWDSCAVEHCGSRANKNSNLSYHRFPRANERFVNKQNLFGNSEKIDLFNAWKNALKISNITKRTRVCSLHFKKSDYLFADVQASRRYLKKNAVPSCNLPGDEIKKIKEEKDKARLERREKRSDASNSISSIRTNESLEASTGQAVDTVVCVKSENIVMLKEEVIHEENEIQENMYIGQNVNDETSSEIDATQHFLSDMLVKSETPEPLVKDQIVQVNTDCLLPNIMRSLQNNKQLSTATGLESFELLNTIVDIVKDVSNNKFEHYNMIMNTRDRVIMTYVKLKQNISYDFLAVLFDCYSSKHCQHIVDEMIKILSKCLKTAIPWPSREEISKNLPKCFEGFENVRVVLNCTEIFIQHPANLCCQALTYSHYKNSDTIKVMTGVSPAGNITFVSKMYGGRATDSDIFHQSDLIKLLEPGDGVMVDRGFLIDEVCRVNKWKCIKPPFLKDEKQFTKEESLLTSKIAAARVHIERLNERMQTFKILGSSMPSTLVPLAEDIFTVICGTINMSAPILNDDEFMDSQ